MISSNLLHSRIAHLHLQGPRQFHAQTRSRASILFALHALSNSRETQHFNKLSRLERVEHSPALKLIKTGAIDPLVVRPTPVVARAPRVQYAPRTLDRLPSHVRDAKAIHVGRTILADNARAMNRMSHALERAVERAARSDGVLMAERAAWAKERHRLQNEMRMAGLWIIGSVMTATGLALWRFWPQQRAAIDMSVAGRPVSQDLSDANLNLEPAMRSNQRTSLEQTSTAVVPHVASLSLDSILTHVSVTPGVSSSLSRPWWHGLLWAR